MIIFYVLLYFSLLLIFILQVIIIHHLFTNLALQWSKKSYLSRASIMVCHQRSQTWGIINGGSIMRSISYSFLFFPLGFLFDEFLSHLHLLLDYYILPWVSLSSFMFHSLGHYFIEDKNQIIDLRKELWKEIKRCYTRTFDKK